MSLNEQRDEYSKGLRRILATSPYEPARSLQNTLTREASPIIIADNKPGLNNEPRTVILDDHQDDLVVTVVIRSDLTQRVYQAWKDNISKRIASPSITLTTELMDKTKYIVLSKGINYESFKLWLRERKEPQNVPYITSDWMVMMIKTGQYQNPLNFEVSNFVAPLESSTILPVPSAFSFVKANTLPASIGNSSFTGNPSGAEAPLIKTMSDVPTSSGPVAVQRDKRSYACIQTGDIRALNANRYITDILEELQGIYELIGDEWRSQGYKKCIGMLKQQPRITKMEQLNGLKGIGSSIREKIQEIMETGTLKKLNNFKNDPKIKTLTELSGIWGVGEKTASELMKKGYYSVKDLRERGIQSLTIQQRIGLRYYEEFKLKIPRFEVEEIRDVVMEHCQRYRIILTLLVNLLYLHLFRRIAPNASCTVCGSYRRGKPQSGDVDILICPPPGVAELPGDTLAALIKSLEQCNFLTDHLSLPFGYAFPKPDDNGDSSASASLIDEQKDHIENIGRYRASYMGVCLLQKPLSKHRRIDIKVFFVFNS